MSDHDDDDSSAYEPEYEPEQVVVTPNITLQVLSVVPPPLEYMSTLHAQNQEISGRQVWTGSMLLAHVLCHFYEQRNNMFQDKRILELGSGTGLLGMTVSKLGKNKPTCVVLTDGDEQAVSLLRQNLDDPFNAVDLKTVKERFFLWGRSEVASFCDWCRQAYDDDGNVWTTAKETVQFDCIIAGDVMYKSELPRLFFETVDALLVASNANVVDKGDNDNTGVLWLCHVPRATVTHEVVQQAARDAGFEVETVDLSSIPPVEGCPVEDSSRAQVYRITRRLSTFM